MESHPSVIGPIGIRGQASHIESVNFAVFPGDLEKEAVQRRFAAAAEYLDAQDGPIRRYTPAGSDSDSVIECLTVVAGSYRHAQADCLGWPEVLRPVRGELRVTGEYEEKARKRSATR